MEENTHFGGFKVPDSYFESLDGRILNRIHSDGLPQTTGFEVPDNYFNELEDTILKRLDVSEETPGVISIFRRKKLAYITAVAASIAILFTIVFGTQNNSEAFTNIDTNSIETYIEDGNLEFEADELMALLSIESIQELESNQDFFSEENMEDYLIETLDDTTILIE